MSKRITVARATFMISNSSKWHHSLKVGKFMRALAAQFGDNEDDWELTGLLHDLDYDFTLDEKEKHGLVTAERIEGQVPERVIEAIKSHDHRTGLKAEGRLARLLRAADALEIVVEGLEKEGKKVRLSTIKSRLKDPKSSKPWLAPLVSTCKDFGITVDKFIRIRLAVEKNLAK